MRMSHGAKCVRLFPEGEMPSEFKAVMDGILLGDGFIKKSQGILCVPQAFKRFAWLKQIERRLYSFGCVSNIDVIRPSPNWKPAIIRGRVVEHSMHCVFRTKSYIEFKEQRLRWYPEGKKIVPADLKLTPEGIAYWFAGDGCRGPNGQLAIHTESFTAEEIDRLISLLPAPARRHLSSLSCIDRRPLWHIAITRQDDAWRFAKMIRKHMAICTRYKLAQVRQKVSTKTKSEVIEQVRQLYAKGHRMTAVMKQTGVSEGVYCNIVSGKLKP